MVGWHGYPRGAHQLTGESEATAAAPASNIVFSVAAFSALLSTWGEADHAG
jgi:hypothetical protein